MLRTRQRASPISSHSLLLDLFLTYSPFYSLSSFLSFFLFLISCSFCSILSPDLSLVQAQGHRSSLLGMANLSSSLFSHLQRQEELKEKDLKRKRRFRRKKGKKKETRFHSVCLSSSILTSLYQTVYMYIYRYICIGEACIYVALFVGVCMMCQQVDTEIGSLKRDGKDKERYIGRSKIDRSKTDGYLERQAKERWIDRQIRYLLEYDRVCGYRRISSAYERENRLHVYRLSDFSIHNTLNLRHVLSLYRCMHGCIHIYRCLDTQVSTDVYVCILDSSHLYRYPVSVSVTA